MRQEAVSSLRNMFTVFIGWLGSGVNEASIPLASAHPSWFVSQGAGSPVRPPRPEGQVPPAESVQTAQNLLVPKATAQGKLRDARLPVSVHTPPALAQLLRETALRSFQRQVN